MKNIPFNLSACLITIMLLFTSLQLFSQAEQAEIKKEVTDSSVTTESNDNGYVKGITSTRAISLFEGLLGLTSIIIGWRAKNRTSKTAGKAAVAVGILAVILSIVHLTLTAGAVFGSGSGKAGAIIALVLGLTGIILGTGVVRSKQT